MKKKILRNFICLLSVFVCSQYAKADTSILTEENGYTKITELPANLSDYYFILVDKDNDLMMTLANGANQGSDKKTMWYKASVDPATDINRIWEIESNGAGFSFRNPGFDNLLMQTEWNAAWNFRSNDQPSSANVEWTRFLLAYNADSWTVQNGRYPDSGYLGPWNNVIEDHAEVACNKLGDAIGHFAIYSILKSDFNELYVKNLKASMPVDMKWAIFDEGFEIWGNSQSWGYAWNGAQKGNTWDYFVRQTSPQTNYNGAFAEMWGGSGINERELNQTIKGLASGYYCVSAYMQSYQGNATFFVRSGDKTLNSITFNDPNKTSIQKRDLYFVLPEAADVTIGLIAHSSTSAKKEHWVSIDNFSLSYLKTLDEFPIDLTNLLTNPYFDKDLSTWTCADTYTRHGGNGFNGKSGFVEFCNWGASSWKGSISKTLVGLPNGKYLVKAAGQASADNVTVTLTANGKSSNLSCIGDKGGNIAADGSVVASGSGVAGWQYFEVECVVSDGTLNIKAEGSATASQRWANVDHFTLTMLEKIDLTELQNALATKKEEAQGVNQDGLNTFVKNQLNEAISGANNAEQTEEGLTAAINNLNLAIGLANDMRQPLAKVYDLLAVCNSYYTNSEADDKTAFKEAIDEATTNIESAETVDAVNAIYNTLEQSRQTYVTSGAIPNDGYPFDITFKIVNTDFDSNISGWETVSPAVRNGNVGFDNKSGFAEFCDWGGASWKGSISQVVNGLSNGIYVVKAAAQASGDNVTLSLTANETTTNLNCIGASGGNIAPDGSVVELGSGVAGWQYIEVECAVTDGVLTIKSEGTATAINRWANIDHFMLYMKDGLGLYELRKSINYNLEEANAIVGKMDADVKEQLDEAIDGADVDSDVKADLEQMLDNLQKAIAAAKTSIADYSKLKKYIDMTAIFANVETYVAKYDNGEYASSDVEPVRQELNVIRYNAASAVFTNKVDVKNWTGSMGTRSDQHWSGETKQYYDANSWNDIDPDALTSKINLIKGTYVLKVAGRADARASLTLEVLGQVITFHGKGDTGYGIDTQGNANFSDEGTYANDDKGRGWEWEFLKFELDSDQEVELKVNSGYNNISQVWTSFGDISLWMDDETYLNVNSGAINEPLAKAKELVNTLPMGENENTSLSDAIELAEGIISTPEDLNNAINALTTAVANANTWRTTYYAEKDKLVAQLERFETDYNDAENGSLDYMNKNRWTTVIEKAQAAAVAKDNQTSHTVLTTATNELKTALDSARVSIGEYAELKKTIDEANSLVGANVGDQPFEKPQSAADAISTTDEQALYDEATADGEGVTSVTAALKEGIATFNNTPLNAPKDGARYNLVLNNNYGWTYDGKAVTYLANNRPDMGLYNIQYWSAVNANYAQAFTFTAVDGQQDCYYISMTDVDGNERYVSTGVVYGGNANQIRTTTNADDALAVKVIATKTDGVHNLYNVEANNYIGSQDAGFYTVNSHINFNIQEASTVDVTLTISSAKWSTLILPFNAELPEGVKAYTCAGVIDGVLTFNEASTIEANTPYLVGGNAGKYDFSGYGLADKDVYTEGLFTGTYVDYQTEAGKHIYVLQKHDNEVAFYEVRESAQPWVRANRCYITYESASEARVLRLGFDDTSGIDNVLFPTDNSELTIYDTMGRKVKSMKKGSLYIINGKKVVVK